MRYDFTPERLERIENKEKFLELVRMLRGICILMYNWWNVIYQSHVGTIIMAYSFNLNIYLLFVLICPTFGNLFYVVIC